MVGIGFIALAGLIALGIWSALHERSRTYDDRMVMLKTLVEAAKNQVGHYQGLEKKGVLSTQEAQAQAREALRATKFQGDNYFFMYTYEGITILLPPTPEKEGTSRIEVKDAKGVPLIRNLIAAGRSGGGFTAYDYPRSGQTEALPKVAYAANIEGWNWIIGAGLYVDDIDTAFRNSLLMFGMVILALSAVVFGVISTISGSVLRQLGGEPRHAMEAMKQVASGDLTVELKAADNHSLLAELNALIHSLRSLIAEIYTGAESITSASQHIRQSSSTVANAATTQAEATQGMAAAMEELTVSISQISDNASATEQFATGTVDAAELGEKQVSAAVSSMSDLTAAITEAVQRINSLDHRAKEVGSIAATIKDIAGQTNLLALNAAIEAARAGESGRGFAVVADEVRKLAERTSKATSEIEDTLSAIQAETEGAVGAMHQAATQANHSVGEVSESADVLKKIAMGAAQANQLIADVANAAREQRSASNALAQQVENIALSAEETSSSMTATATSANALEQVATTLHGAVRRFRC
jgi:methyl-accepting chemotaxis protein